MVVGMSNPIEAGIGPDRDNERVLRYLAKITVEIHRRARTKKCSICAQVR